MLGLDLWEILIILVVAVIFVNPKDLPRFFRSIGRLYGQWKSLTFNLNRTIKTAMQEEADRVLNQITAPVSPANPETEAETKPDLNASAQEPVNPPVKLAIPSKAAKKNKETQPVAGTPAKKKITTDLKKKSQPPRDVVNHPRKSVNSVRKKKGAQL